MALKKVNNKKVKKTPEATKKAAAKRAENGSRLRQLNRRQNKKKVKVVQRDKALASSWSILRQSLTQLFKNKKLFLGTLAVYGVLYILFVKGISANFQLGNLRQSLGDAFGGQLGTVGTGVALYGLLLGSASTGATEASAIYQTLFIIIASLALIWALRQTYQKQSNVRVRDGFYKGMYPFVPFVIVMVIIVIQLIPALITTSAFSVLQNGGITAELPGRVLSYAILLSGLCLSLFWLSSSMFALYIVTLPDGSPMAALRAARRLVRYRRALIIRRVLFLPVVLVLFSATILIPLIIFIAPAAEVLFTLFTVTVIAVVHSYFYNLYRNLL